MNSCVLMAKVIKSPELRYTVDQKPVTNMIVEFEGVSPNDPPQTVKAVGWGNIALEINEQYKEGDQIVMEGRLSMNMIERQEGFKEKRAELIISRIVGVSGSSSSSNYQTSTTSNQASNSSNVIPFQSNPTTTATPSSSPFNQNANQISEENLDDIPF